MAREIVFFLGFAPSFRELRAIAAALLGLAFSATASEAALIGGTAPEIAPPTDVVGGGAGNVGRIFAESLAVTLQSELSLDHIVSLEAPNDLVETVSPESANSGIVRAGTVINSYYFFLDPVWRYN